MEAMHKSMQRKDSRIMRLLRQLEESRAEAQILRLKPSRECDPEDYDLYQARLAASDREQLRAKDRMLQLYDEREEDNQRSVDQLHETLRFLTQRIDALLIVQDRSLPLSVRDELQRVILSAVSTLPQGESPDMLGREMGTPSKTQRPHSSSARENEVPVETSAQAFFLSSRLFPLLPRNFLVTVPASSAPKSCIPSLLPALHLPLRLNQIRRLSASARQ